MFYGDEETQWFSTNGQHPLDRQAPMLPSTTSDSPRSPSPETTPPPPPPPIIRSTAHETNYHHLLLYGIV